MELPAIRDQSPALASLTSKFPITITFPKSSGLAYPVAISIAQQASAHADIDFTGKILHVAAFEATHAQLKLALMLLEHVRFSKGAYSYISGTIQTDWYKLQGTINCYLRACASSDSRAHCHVVIRHAQEYPERTFPVGKTFLKSEVTLPAAAAEPLPLHNAYLMPCAYLFRQMRFRVDPAHPSSWQDQIQAASVSHGCDWCPNFNATDFKRLEGA